MNSVIEIDGLIKTFGRVRALDGLDLRVEAGEIHGFLGPNGAGKTTTIRILLGMIRSSAGTAHVFGRDPWHDAVAVHSRVSYVPGDVTLWPNLTGGEVIDLLGRLHGGTDADLRTELINRFELDPTKRCRTYSKGNRQKVALVAAFAADAELLILDEPTSGLDPLMEEAFSRCVREQAERGRTVLLSSHLLGEVEALCDRVSIVRAGRLVESAALDRLRGSRQSKIIAELGSPARLDGLPGLHDVDIDHNHLQCRVDATALDQLLARLTESTVLSLTCSPPSLEDIFLSHYESVHPGESVPAS